MVKVNQHLVFVSMLVLSFSLVTAHSGEVAARGTNVNFPCIINYQGRIMVSGSNFDGTGQFKFALVSGAGASLWSHDNTSASGSEPTAAVALTVTRGLYAIRLGDTTVTGITTAIPTTIFKDNLNIQLRVWFATSSTGTFTQLSPDQRLVAVGYAAVADQAHSIGGVVAADIAKRTEANAFSVGGQSIQNDDDAKVALTVTRNAATQTANLTEWKEDAGTGGAVLAAVDPTGKFTGTSDNADNLGTVAASAYVRNDQGNSIDGPQAFSNSLSLVPMIILKSEAIGGAGPNLMEWRDKDNVLLSSINNDGSFTGATGSITGVVNATTLTVTNNTTLGTIITDTTTIKGAATAENGLNVSGGNVTVANDLIVSGNLLSGNVTSNDSITLHLDEDEITGPSNNASKLIVKNGADQTLLELDEVGKLTLHQIGGNTPTIESASPLLIQSSTGSNITIKSNGATIAGGQINIEGGAAGGTDTNGGNANLSGGTGDKAGSGGNLVLSGGTGGTDGGGGVGTGNGGNIELRPGLAAGGGNTGKILVYSSVETPAGQALSLTGGNALSGNNGPDLNITAGDGTGSVAQNGGNIVLNPGSAVNAGLNGLVQVNSALTLQGLVNLGDNSNAGQIIFGDGSSSNKGTLNIATLGSSQAFTLPNKSGIFALDTGVSLNDATARTFKLENSGAGAYSLDVKTDLAIGGDLTVSGGVTFANQTVIDLKLGNNTPSPGSLQIFGQNGSVTIAVDSSQTTDTILNFPNGFALPSKANVFSMPQTILDSVILGKNDGSFGSLILHNNTTASFTATIQAAPGLDGSFTYSLPSLTGAVLTSGNVVIDGIQNTFIKSQLINEPGGHSGLTISENGLTITDAVDQTFTIQNMGIGEANVSITGDLNVTGNISGSLSVTGLKSNADVVIELDDDATAATDNNFQIWDDADAVVFQVNETGIITLANTPVFQTLAGEGITLKSTGAVNNAAGGNITIQGGSGGGGGGGNGGVVSLTAGDGVGSNKVGGNILITAGNGTGTANGGGIQLVPGTTGTGTDGIVGITGDLNISGSVSGNGTNAMLIDVNGDDSTDTLTLQTANGANIIIAPSGAGLIQVGGTTPTIQSANGNSLNLKTSGATANGGGINLTAEDAASGTGGDIGISAGDGVTGAGGVVNLTAGDGAGADKIGGNVVITAGNGTGIANGGGIQLVPGTTGTGTDGVVSITGDLNVTGNISGSLSVTGLKSNADVVIELDDDATAATNNNFQILDDADAVVFQVNETGSITLGGTTLIQTANGNSLNLKTSGTTANGGGINLTAENAASGTGGGIGISAGNGVTGAGGVVNLTAGDGAGADKIGGNVVITAGNGTGNANGGGIQLVPGTTGTGTDGVVGIIGDLNISGSVTGNGTNAMLIDVNGDDSTDTLTLQTANGANIIIAPNGTGLIQVGGTTPTIQSANGNTLNLKTSGATANGGGINLTAEDAASGTGGGIGISAGDGVTGAGGVVNLTAGDGAGTDKIGGNVVITAGNGTGTANGGGIQLVPGTTGTGTDGVVSITGDLNVTGNISGSLSVTGLKSNADVVIELDDDATAATNNNFQILDDADAVVFQVNETGSITLGGTPLIQTANGNALNLKTSGATANGGGINITAEDAASGTGGGIGISAGDGVTGAGGVVNLTAGDGAGTDKIGGNVVITAGNGTGTANGGGIQLVPGTTGTGTDGIVRITGDLNISGSVTGNGINAMLIDVNGDDSTDSLTLQTANGANIIIAPSGAGLIQIGGTTPTLQAVDNRALTLKTSGATAGGSAINLIAENANSGTGGAIGISAGDGVTGAGGPVGLTAGDGAGTNMVGGDVVINAGTGTGTANNGLIILNPGSGGSGTVGAVQIGGPTPTIQTASGKALNLITSGASTNGGAINIIAENGGASDGNGGGVNITAGNGTDATNPQNGGDITLTPGNNVNSGTDGSVIINKGVKISSTGAKIVSHLSATLTPPALPATLSANGTTDVIFTSATTPGVASGDTVITTITPPAGVIWSVFVSGSNEVTVRFFNNTGSTPAVPAVQLDVWKH